MKRSILLCICFFLMMSTSLYAQETLHDLILIHSKELPYLYLVQTRKDQSLDVYVIPSDVYVSNVPLKELSTQSLHSQLKDHFKLNVENDVDVSLDTIDQDFGLDHETYDLTTMKGMTDYFVAVKNKLSMSDILHYQRYIDSDLSLSEYYDFYQMFSKKVIIHYHYLPVIQSTDFSIPLRTIFSN